MSRCFEAYNGNPLERTRRTGAFSWILDVFLDLMRDRLTDFFIRLEERCGDRLLDIYNTEDNLICSLQIVAHNVFNHVF